MNAFDCTFKKMVFPLTKDDCKRCEQRKNAANKIQPLRKFPRICEYSIEMCSKTYVDPVCVKCGKLTELFLVSDAEWEHYIPPDERSLIICPECYATIKALPTS